MKRILIKLSAIFWVFMTLNGKSQSITNGLVAYYPFNGNANDVSGYGNNGTVYNAVLTNDRFGNPNRAYLFDGSSSYIQVPSSASLESNATTNQITQTAWIYLKGWSTGNTYPKGPITQKTAFFYGEYMYRMNVHYTQLAQGYTHWSIEYGSPYAFNLNEWYFVATTFNGSTGKIAKNFINGVRLDSAILNTNIIQNNYPLTIGKDPHEISEYFNGIIDELRIYNRALSESEIQILYSASLSPLPLTLTRFQATLKTNLVELKWQTENEVNTKKFVVERAIKNNDFEEIATVNSTNTISNDYAYNDNIGNVEPATMFYRLKQVDKDGKFAYSNIVSVKVINTTKAKIFPNPVTSITTIQLQSERAENVTIKIVSSDGKILSTKRYSLTAGNNQMFLTTECLAAGVYAVVIAGQNINERLTFSKH